ncbi:MAG: glutamate ligase domain-containing protein, partial [Bacteroidales bacterium]
NRPVIWIAGGQDKGSDYRALAEVVSKKVKALVCLGLDNRRLKDFFEDRVQAVFEADTIGEAVRTAYMAGAPNDIVLLSPACASFDRFNDYTDRGRQFKQAVYDL